MANNTSQNTRSNIDHGFHIPPPPDGGTTETLAISQRLLERYANSIREREQKIAKIEDIKTEWKAAVIKQVGETTWKKFLDYSREQRMSNFGLKEVSHDSDGLAQLAMAKRKAREGSLMLLKDANLEQSDLKGIHRRFSKEIDCLLRQEEPKVQKLEIVPESKVPEGILMGKNNPWRNRRPPYDGWDWSYDWTTHGGQNPDVSIYLDSANGSVGSRSEYRNYDAGDWDYFWLDAYTNVGIWYLPAHAGQQDVYIRARCASARYNIWLNDEFGWSNCYVNMYSSITVNISPVASDAQSHLAWFAHEDGNPDNTRYIGDVIRPDSILYYHLVTSDPIPHGWTWISIGTSDTHFGCFNDVSVNSVMRNWLYLDQISLEVL